MSDKELSRYGNRTRLIEAATRHLTLKLVTVVAIGASLTPIGYKYGSPIEYDITASALFVVVGVTLIMLSTIGFVKKIR